MSSISLYHDNIFNNINIGLLVVDQDENILMWNAWMVKHSGISSEIALTKKINEVFNTPPSPAFLNALRNILQYGLPVLLSNALHRAPLALFSDDDENNSPALIDQSITLTSLSGSGEKRCCLIQITDASTSIKREKMLRSHSELLKKDATTDSLTGLFNRRFFDEHYRISLGQAIRQKLPMSIFMIDIDYFKQYNDYYGHPTGDKVLIQVANALKSQISRSSDMLARYGGEEFILVLPNMTDEHGLQFAEKIIDAIAKLNIPHLKSKTSDRITISIGLSTYDPSKHSEASALVDAADTALYRAKHQGRNRAAFLALDTLIAHRHQAKSSET